MRRAGGVALGRALFPSSCRLCGVGVPAKKDRIRRPMEVCWVRPIPRLGRNAKEEAVDGSGEGAGVRVCAQFPRFHGAFDATL